MPVYIHNLKGYDSHFIIPALNKYGYKNEDKDLISAIPINEEKYISFSKKIKIGSYKDKKNGEEHILTYEIRFLDTNAFMAESLCRLADNLKSGCDTTEERRKRFPNTSEQFERDDQFEAMIMKGIYPYDYISTYDKLYETDLPPMEAFYSKLNDEHCKKEDYDRALKVWNQFNCQTILDYHNIYLQTDVLLLADIFENFKLTCYSIYGLDPSYYYTSPGLSWDAFLKHATDEYREKKNEEFYIELLTDIDMYNFVESGIRGGLSQISKRYAKANNKYMQQYDPSKKDEYILYLDANNLYGYAMCEYLPKGNFKWNEDEWTTDKILQLDDRGDKGYIFSVDIHYPDHLHDLHNEYPLAPENQAIKKEWLSAWQQENYQESKIEKLITSFSDKKDYVINYRLLKLYIQQGLQIKINRVLQFDQDDFMKGYIMKNTIERAKAKNSFERDFYKLLNNSVYGKTLESVRKRINFRLISSEESALRIRNERIKYTIFNESLVGVHLCKKVVKLNKPVFIGACVLDQSKFLMNDFHYNHMLKYFERKNINLLFTDTDSLCYHIKNQDPYEMMKQHHDLFDTSDYPKDHPLYSATNKKVIGKFKDESNSIPITQFIGLRSKLYAYTVDGEDHEHMKAKGVKKCVMNKQIQFENYKQTLFNRQSYNVSQNTFRSFLHQLYTISQTKVALSAVDDKIHISDNNITCYSFSHYKIR
jgi:hypothetical protein